MLQHLDPIDRTFLAQAGGACRAAVAACDLPCAGTRRVVSGKSVWVVTHRLGEFCTSVERLAWAKASGCPWVERICRSGRTPAGAEVGEGERLPVGSDDMLGAARRGHLEVLQWAREQGCPWDSWNTCSTAAQGGHLYVLQYARAHGCPWDSRTCAHAARHGNLQVLKWAREHGCPWTTVARDAAATMGYFDNLPLST